MLENTEKLLLELVAVAMGNRDSLTVVPTQAEWSDIYGLAEAQGLVGIVFSAIEKLPKSALPEMDLLMDWLGQTEYMKTNYEVYQHTIAKLAEVYNAQYLRMMVLKGYGCSLVYPVPALRPCGDIDIYLYTKEKGRDGVYTQFADDLIHTRFAVDVDKELRHHTQFEFEGFTVENHNTILEIHTHKSSRVLNEMLEGLVKDCTPVKVCGQEIWLPSVKFNSIHLLRHMANDFATYKTSMRHVLDWATFVNANDVDWAFVQKVAKESNMHKFLDAINSICVGYLGYPADRFPLCSQLTTRSSQLRDRVLADILHPEFDEKIVMPKKDMSREDALGYGWAKTRRLWANRWKYRIVYNESLLQSFWWLTKNRIKSQKSLEFLNVKAKLKNK